MESVNRQMEMFEERKKKPSTSSINKLDLKKNTHKNHYNKAVLDVGIVAIIHRIQNVRPKE